MDIHTQHLAEMWLLISILLYFIMNGAGLFETIVLIPKWTIDPPDSFAMFKGNHGIDLKTFWIWMHSIHEIAFIIAIYYCWNFEQVRNCLLALFGIHFAIRVWTLAYFAPKIIAFQKIANSGDVPDGLLIQTTKWRRLNYLRTVAFFVVSFGVLWVYLRMMMLL